MSAFSESTGYKLGIVNHSPVSICVTSVHLRSTLFIWLGAVCLTGADGSAPAWAVLVARFDSPAVDGVRLTVPHGIAWGFAGVERLSGYRLINLIGAVVTGGNLILSSACVRCVMARPQLTGDCTDTV